MEFAGQHQGEETAAAGEKADRRGRDGATGEGKDGGRGGGGAKTQRGRLRGQNKEGAKGRKAKQWEKDSAEEYPSG